MPAPKPTVDQLQTEVLELREALAAMKAELLGLKEGAKAYALRFDTDEVAARIVQVIQDAGETRKVLEITQQEVYERIQRLESDNIGLRAALKDDVLELYRRIGERSSVELQRSTLEGLADVHKQITEMRAQLAVQVTAPPVAERVPTAPSLAPPVATDGSWRVVQPAGGAGVVGPQPGGAPNMQMPPGVVQTSSPAGGGWQIVPPPGAGR